MKKLFLMGVLTLVILTACQSETSNPDEIQKAKIENASKKALKLVKQQSGVIGKGDVTDGPIGPNDAYIDCHTDFNNTIGNSCVWVDGQLFNVSWYTNQVIPTSGAPYSEKVYSATAVDFCNCN